jgi:hypothetical protein
MWRRRCLGLSSWPGCAGRGSSRLLVVRGRPAWSAGKVFDERPLQSKTGGPCGPPGSISVSLGLSAAGLRPGQSRRRWTTRRGTFIRVFKQIKPVYKFPFSQHYTRYLPRHDFDTIHTYLLCIRALRNRCAHGNHLVSINLVNQLNQYSLIKDSARVTNPALDCSEFELTLLFLFHNLICFRELIRDLHVVLLAYEPVYSRYGGKQSINPTICAKLFR